MDQGIKFSVYSVAQVALFVANGGDDVLGFFGHFFEVNVDYGQTPLSNMMAL